MFHLELLNVSFLDAWIATSRVAAKPIGPLIKRNCIEIHFEKEKSFQCHNKITSQEFLHHFDVHLQKVMSFMFQVIKVLLEKYL